MTSDLNLDVWLKRDSVLFPWKDFYLNKAAYEVNFAPDYAESAVIWTLTHSGDGDYLLTSTVTWAGWGDIIGDTEFEGVLASMYADLDFPDNYESNLTSGNTIVYTAVSDCSGGGGVYRIDGMEAPDPSVVTDLGINDDVVSLVVSDGLILAGALSVCVYSSCNFGDTWNQASLLDGPTYVCIARNDFATISRLAYASTLAGC